MTTRSVPHTSAKQQWRLTVEQWKDGRRGQDGWGRYTRRRKWYRDAELVEITPSTEITPAATPRPGDRPDVSLSELDAYRPDDAPPEYSAEGSEEFDADGNSKMRRRRWFRRGSRTTLGSATGSSGSVELRRDDDEPVHTPLHQERDNSWGLGDDATMQLG